MSVIHDLWIGKKVHVTRARHKGYEGVAGRIVDETKHLIVVETTHGEKKIPKQGTTFTLTIDRKKHEVEGNTVLVPPYERIKLKVQQ